jgi:hypothetical protein
MILGRKSSFSLREVGVESLFAPAVVLVLATLVEALFDCADALVRGYDVVKDDVLILLIKAARSKTLLA